MHSPITKKSGTILLQLRTLQKLTGYRKSIMQIRLALLKNKMYNRVR
jgi:hypothetical protein